MDTYKKRCKHQLDEWVKGNPSHNTVDDECCPDFSCCRPELLAEENVRKAFANANDETRSQFLGVFISAALSGESAHITGFEETEQ